MKRQFYTIFILVVLINLSFSEGFEETFGGDAYEAAYTVIDLADDNQLVVGGYSTSFSSSGLGDACLIKIDYSGNLIWSNTYGGDANDYSYSVAQALDGGIVSLGYSCSDASGWSDLYLIKVDTDGILEWEKMIGGASTEYGYSVKLTEDGGFILAGSSKSFGVGDRDAYLVKTDSEGEVEWSKVYGGTEDDEFASVALTDDGGFIITGFTKSNSAGQTDIYIVKTDSIGNEEWDIVKGGTDFDEGKDIIIDQNNNFLITGYTRSFNVANCAAYLFTLDNSGAEIDFRILEDQNGLTTYGKSITKSLSAYDILLAGHIANNEYDFQLFAHRQGEFDEFSFGGSYLETANCLISILETEGMGEIPYAILVGETNSFGAGANDFYIVKKELPICIGIEESNDELSIMNYELKQNYPNPFNPVTEINYKLQITNYELAEIVVHNSAGQKVWSSGNLPFTIHHSPLHFDGSKFNSGIYYYSLIVDGMKMDTKSMVLIK